MTTMQSKRSLETDSLSHSDGIRTTKLSRPAQGSYKTPVDGRPARSPHRCQICSSIDIEAIYKMDPGTISSNGVPVLEMGGAPSPSSSSSSPPSMACGDLCDMVWEIYRRRDVGSEVRHHCHLRVFSCLSVLGLARTQPRLNLSPSLVIAVVSGRAERGIPLSVRDEALASDIILPTTRISLSHSGPHSLTYIGRHIAPDQIDFALVRDWLRECCEQHPSCSRRRHEHSKTEDLFVVKQSNLTVIDCQTRLLTKLPPGARYIALSYVWGSWAMESVSDTLSASQPLTIEDAICVVLKLGQRYLWIDRYSINQSDDTAKHEAILNMDSIFEEALLVIVSLGIDVNTGLWGVSSAHRRPQPTTIFRGLHLVSSGIVLEDAVRQSKWAYRGWTFQEAVLSQRMLLFSPDQVYWKCLSTAYRESVQQPPVADGRRHKVNSAFDPDVFSEANQRRKRFGEMSLPLYTKQVAEYTKRELTYQSDALHAFRAILSRSGELTFYGIPVFMTQEHVDAEPSINNGGFVIGLLWSRNAHTWYKPWFEYVRAGASSSEATELRKEFPSWSWASTNCCVQFDPLSFDRELSSKYGQLHAPTSSQALYVNVYATIRLGGRYPLVEAISKHARRQDMANSQDKQAAESTLPSSLSITSLVVPWELDSNRQSLASQTQSSPCTMNVLLQLSKYLDPSETNNTHWLTQGTIYLDYESETSTVCQPGYCGTALLLVHYYRYNYNWRHIVWWLAIKPDGDLWRRIGLIRSVFEVQTPTLLAKDMHSEADRNHRLPLLLSKAAMPARIATPPSREALQDDFQTVQVG